jgi:hypothetical protein
MLTPVRRPKRVVVKLGTGVLTSGVGRLDTARIADVCGQLSRLRAAGTEVIVVSSGAIGLGMGRLALAKRPAETTKTSVPEALSLASWAQTLAILAVSSWPPPDVSTPVPSLTITRAGRFTGVSMPPPLTLREAPSPWR